jgi:hypothetical protein
MKISLIRRLRLARAFYKALGDKNHNAVLAIVHESGVADVTAGDLPAEYVKAVVSEKKSAAGYDYEH